MGIILIGDVLTEEDLPWKFYLYYELKASVPTNTQVFLDFGKGYQEQHSFRFKVDASNKYVPLIFKLPKQDIFGVRIDPMDRTGVFSIRNIAFKDEFGNLIKQISVEKVRTNQDIGRIKIDNATLSVQTTRDGRDPSMILDLKYPINYSTIYPLYKRFWATISTHQGRWARKMGLMLLIVTAAFILNLYHPQKNALNVR